MPKYFQHQAQRCKNYIILFKNRRTSRDFSSLLFLYFTLVESFSFEGLLLLKATFCKKIYLYSPLPPFLFLPTPHPIFISRRGDLKKKYHISTCAKHSPAPYQKPLSLSDYFCDIMASFFETLYPNLHLSLEAQKRKDTLLFYYFIF